MTATNKCYNFVGFRCRVPLKSVCASLLKLNITFDTHKFMAGCFNRLHKKLLVSLVALHINEV